MALPFDAFYSRSHPIPIPKSVNPYDDPNFPECDLPRIDTKEYELIEVGVNPPDEKLKKRVEELSQKIDIIPPPESSPDEVKDFFREYPVGNILPFFNDLTLTGYALVTLEKKPENKPEGLITLVYKEKEKKQLRII